ncbi:hypothetical protein I203_100990 [Kwoniella mangroviensis CBS 8507]|uniref:uncharacterized protein n=1 Tax=Kwoniella mangroviensis CBS 8507 TaxID=1296122 RepID=UPI00080D0965|nr:myo-inositol 2-dehydrogenase [Kwoniella mangroviensis CBS 8507]OCF67971.1 myo-inositol 2-dehydrogenase [Kwoniella mangroviensis CBS 8507]
MSLQRKLRYAVLGIGRMGSRHAQNIAYRTPRAELVSICDPRPTSLTWAEKHLPSDIRVYQDSKTLFNECGDEIDAVLIASETGSHASLAIEAMRAGKHVLLEKPISIDLETSRTVVEETKKFPDLKVMVGFSRRFDESYRSVKEMIDQGKLGEPHLIKSATNDQHDPSGFFVSYASASGGIFIDCGIHDIDLARWYLSPQGIKQVKRVFALGHNIQHPELAKYDDVDNGVGVVEFENGKILVVHVNRTMNHGHDCFTEVFGKEGKVVVNGNPQLNRVEIRDTHGVRTESTPTYYERFREAFVNEVNEFTDVVLDNKPLPVSCEDALEATKIATALTHSFKSGQPVYFSSDGQPILV